MSEKMPPTRLLGQLLEGIGRELPRAVELRHRLHARPELAHAEEWTSQAIAQALPVPCATVAGTGRIARVGPDAGAPVAVRAELDGLPIEERTGAPFSANGNAMHACGHDVHMAALVALTRAAHALNEELPVPLLAVLQPSEEAYPSGALELAYGSQAEPAHGSPEQTGRGPSAELAPEQTARGPSAELAPEQTARGPLAELAPEQTARGPLAELAPEQTARGPLAELAPAAIVAAHVHPELRWGTVALDEGAVNASCDAVEIVVEGQPTHGAYPHRGADPILALAQIVVALHAQLGRRMDPLHPATLTVGVMEGGGVENVIPAQALARAALRAHRPEERLALRAMVRQVVAGVAAAHDCRARVALTTGEPALENDPGIVARAHGLLAGAGFERAPEWRSCGSDDFAFFAALAPIAMAFVGLDGAEGFTRRPLHHPELLVPDSAVGAVARVQALLYTAALTPAPAA
jgi:metal-dependent amidase/aminoacylase/carboxypeptidase family protein